MQRPSHLLARGVRGLPLLAAAVAVWLLANLLPGQEPVQPAAVVEEVEEIVPEDSVAPQMPHFGSYFDLDAYLEGHAPGGAVYDSDWTYQCLPTGIIYRSYLAGTKEPRFSLQSAWIEHGNAMLDATLGCRVGLLRYGNHEVLRPEGFQIDVEGAAFPRLDVGSNNDLVSTDFRVGLPITFSLHGQEWKFGFYHLSSHLGDEFLLKNPNYPRLNFERDVLVLGYSRYFGTSIRLYGEADWAFHTDVSKAWEFQFGAEYVPLYDTGMQGAPFVAVNAHLRQEVNYGGAFTAQAGWAWRSGQNGRLLRIGLLYFTGKSDQYSFYADDEEQFGAGLWHDF